MALPTAKVVLIAVVSLALPAVAWAVGGGVVSGPAQLPLGSPARLLNLIELQEGPGVVSGQSSTGPVALIVLTGPERRSSMVVRTVPEGSYRTRIEFAWSEGDSGFSRAMVVIRGGLDGGTIHQENSFGEWGPALAGHWLEWSLDEGETKGMAYVLRSLTALQIRHRGDGLFAQEAPPALSAQVRGSRAVLISAVLYVLARAASSAVWRRRSE